MNNAIKNTIQILKDGGIVVFPTDTVYGIGCRLDNQASLKRLFSIRNRPEEKAVLAVVDSVEMAQKYLQPIPKDVSQNLINKYWPGGLTIILPCRTDKVPSTARGGGLTLGVRQTNHPVLIEILRAIKVPLVAPSANFAGEPTPRSFREIDSKLLEMVDTSIEGECGGNLASTVIDCSVRPWKLIRQGEVKIEGLGSKI